MSHSTQYVRAIRRAGGLQALAHAALIAAVLLALGALISRPHFGPGTPHQSAPAISAPEPEAMTQATLPPAPAVARNLSQPPPLLGLITIAIVLLRGIGVSGAPQGRRTRPAVPPSGWHGRPLLYTYLS